MLKLLGHSLKARIILSTLVVFLIIIWSSAYLTEKTLQHDLGELLGTQQLGTASIIAAEVNNQLEVHQRSLEQVSATFHEEELRDPARAQRRLESLPVFQSLFNGGTFVTDSAGIAQATFPATVTRQGVNYFDRDYVHDAIVHGKMTIGRPVMGRMVPAPIVGIATPIRGANGKVIGALAGVINLKKSSFLVDEDYSQISGTSNYLIVDARHRVIISDGKRQRILEPLSAPGIRPVIDRFVKGFEGNLTFVNPAGVEVLASVKQIPAAGWYVSVQIPTAEAFAPIDAMQQRVWLAALVLSMLACLLIWFILNKELAPLEQTAGTLALLSNGKLPLQALPLTQRTEMDQLIGAFNLLIAELEQRQSALNQSEALYRTAFRTNPDAVSITRMADGRYVDINDAFLDMFGWSREEVIGQTVAGLGVWKGAEDRAELVRQLQETGACQNLDAELMGKDGRLFSVLVSASIVALAGEPCLLAVVRDITAQKAAAEQIERLAFTDALTSLPNRRFLLDRLDQSISNSLRYERLGALVYIDLDDFKSINDTLGHDQGDLFLVEVAQLLRTHVRQGDTVARLGGDEFVVLLEHLSPHVDEAATQAKIVAEKILQALNLPSQFGDVMRHGAASIGITLFGDQPESMVEPLKRADLAMYQAKAAGRNLLRFFDPDMQAMVSARVALEARLRKAIDRQQFVLLYQPQVTTDRVVVGCEALLRWNDPQRGLVSPQEFISLAEETGLILPLGAWVLETACRQLHEWAGQADKAQLKISVNVSALQLYSEDFVKQVEDVLARTGAPPQRLVLELTESLLVTNMEATIAKMDAIKRLGVSFSLDDFGTGFSSLSYLKRLPLDQLKIDSSFVRDILVDPNDMAIATMIIMLASSMGLSVIAEGVETAAQCNILEALGCHHYQGYFFSRPLPLAELELFLQQGTQLSLL